jgi:lysozyme family protein
MTDKILTPQGRFDYAVTIVLEHEGGYSNDPDDPGGETNFGITETDLKEHMSHFTSFPSDVKDLTRIEAECFYKVVYWDKYNYNAINSLPIATKIFDMAVNMGSHEAHELIQRALGYCGYSTLIVDGILGGKTLGAINEVCLHGREKDLLSEIINESKWFYEHLVEEKPVLKRFLNGWLDRASWS